MKLNALNYQVGIYYALVLSSLFGFAKGLKVFQSLIYYFGHIISLQKSTYDKYPVFPQQYDTFLASACPPQQAFPR